MASAFAMLFAMMPGMGGEAATDTGEASSKTGDGDAKDGNPADKDGKDVPSDVAVLPGMPLPIPTMPLPTPQADTPIATATTTTTTVTATASTGSSAAPITTLLAAMPTLPDARSPATDVAAATLPTTDAPTPSATTAAMPIVVDTATMTASVTSDAAPTSAIPLATRTDAPRAAAPTAPPMAAQTVSTVPIPTDAVATQTIAVQPGATPILIPADASPVAPSPDGVTATSARRDMPIRFAVTTGSTPVVAPLPVQAPAPMLQPGQTAPAIQLFSLSLRSDQGSADPRTDRRKDEAALSVDPATLARADSLTATPVAATTGAEQAPLDMTQQHWPQAMIDRIDRMREDAATADTRIQLSPDALGGIAVKVSQEGGTTHIHFTAEQAQTATLLADAQPTLARLAEDKGMRLGQTAVDLGQSGGDRQAPPRRPDPVQPARPAFAGTTPSSDAGDPVDASTRIA